MLNEPDSFQSDANATTQIDEHDEPTEPIRSIDVAAFVPTLPNDASSLDEETVPSPKSATQPFPHQYVQPPLVVQSGPQYAPASPSAYPHLPPRLEGPHGNRPAGGVASIQAETMHEPTRTQKVRMIPIVVGMCFVAVQVLLLLRFVLKLLAFSSDISWVAAVYEVSNLFVLPFRILFLQLAIPLLITAELYTLLAILVYGFVSRIVVHILKAFLKTR